MQPTLSDFYEIWYACRTSFPDFSRQLIQAMQPTLSDFYEIWYACRTSFPDSKYTNFFKIGQVEPNL